MDEGLLGKAGAYAKAWDCEIGERLGFGIHGIVVVLESKNEPAATALKVHSSAEPYRRERDIYERLREGRVTRILGFHVPQLLRWDDGLLALEMTVVAPPFVLDFAGAYLDFPPEFPEEVWAEWNRKNEEQFGGDWAMARRILGELEDLGIYMHDPSPGIFAFDRRNSFVLVSRTASPMEALPRSKDQMVFMGINSFFDE